MGRFLLSYEQWNYGDIIAVDLAMDKTVNLPKGFAYVDYKSKSDAEKAQQFMDGAQVDGLVISVKLTRKVSPARGVFPKRDAAPPRRRPPASSPVRRRSPSPGFRRRRRSPNRSPIRRPMGRQRSPAPYRRRSPLPVRRGRTPPRRSSPVRRRSRTPPPRRMRSPPRRMMRSRSRSRSAPRRARSPPNRRGRSSSYSSGSPSPVRRRSPVRGGARKSTRSRSPKRTRTVLILEVVTGQRKPNRLLMKYNLSFGLEFESTAFSRLFPTPVATKDKGFHIFTPLLQKHSFVDTFVFGIGPSKLFLCFLADDKELERLTPLRQTSSTQRQA
ncbi:hypothetical protein SELMODRAFT_403662 [Selaginella moellendorffii]|uniref:RRM domain-containing protein n=1 Tax=Selaginella moellendorffii TaxID=88036 RepID=D8QS47_SELML|nr:hypothetical protein SELMODRAFT_403662 [Selaginella moellendorffii]